MESASMSIDELVETYGERVFNLALRITGNRQDAEDVVNASLRVKRSLDGAYLDSLEERIEAAGDELPAEVREWYDEPDKAVFLQALLDEINRGCLHFMTFRLTDGQRLPYVMRMVLGLSYREMAEVLEISENAVKARLSRARAGLDKFFRARCRWLNPESAACSCASRVPFALAFDPELLDRVRMKAKRTDSDAAYADFVGAQAEKIGGLYRDLPLIAYKTEALKGYLAELRKKK